MSLTGEELEELEEALDDATEGPWYLLGYPWRSAWHSDGLAWPDLASVLAGSPDPHVGRTILCPPGIEEWGDYDEYVDLVAEADCNLELAALAKNLLPGILQEFRRLRTELARRTCDCGYDLARYGHEYYEVHGVDCAYRRLGRGAR